MGWAEDITFDASHIPVPRFLYETFLDSEWLRPYKENGDPYQLGHHYGYDSQAPNNDNRLLSPWKGYIWYPKFGWPFGNQIAIRSQRWPRLSFVMAHCATRVLKENATVYPKNQVAVMGMSGGVPKHVHGLIVLDKTWDRAHVVNPGPAMRKLQVKMKGGTLTPTYWVFYGDSTTPNFRTNGSEVNGGVPNIDKARQQAVKNLDGALDRGFKSGRIELVNG